jgi:putative DNA primase/helicase
VTSNEGGAKLKLDPRHQAELRASGLSAVTIGSAGIVTTTDAEIGKILGWKPHDRDWKQGMLFPYRSVDGAIIPFARIKLDDPRLDDKKLIKYESPRRLGNRAYFPPGFGELFGASDYVLVTEGEKKALAATQAEFPCIGLVGVWGWQRKRARTANGKAVGVRPLISDLRALNWMGRKVYIVFDSDALDKPEIRMAETELAKVLETHGAIVHVVRLPDGGDDEKVGLDDFLVAHGSDGAAELRGLLESALFWAVNGIMESDKPNDLDIATAYLHDECRHADGPTLRYWRNQFWWWTGTHYRVISTDDPHKRMLDWMRKYVAKPKSRLAKDVLDGVAATVLVPEHNEQPIWLENDRPVARPDCVAMQNGILDLAALIDGKKDVMRPNSPRWFSPTVLSYQYDPNAECPEWLKFLDTVFDGDADRIKLLAEWFGYCLTADTSMQAILLMEGPRRSGKGTTLRVLRKLVGEDNCVDPRLSTLDSMFGMWGLLGKPVAICSDVHLPPGNKSLSVLEILKSVSGEDAVEVHRKNLPSVSCRLPIRFTLAVNELPKFADASNALAARLLILPYRESFVGREDRDLEKKLDAEVQGIFLWAIEGLKRLRRNGKFTVPEISKGVADEFARLTSPLQAFIDDACAVGQGLEVDRQELRDAWVRWCATEGHEPGSDAEFGVKLRALVPGLGTSRPRNHDGTRPRRYRGICLRGPRIGPEGPIGPGDSLRTRSERVAEVVAR